MSETLIGIEEDEQSGEWVVTWPAFQAVRGARNTFEEALTFLADYKKKVDNAIEQAKKHGHPTWSHLFAYGPCTRVD